MQMVEISEIYWYVLIAIPVSVGAVLVMRALKYSSFDIGINFSRATFQALMIPCGVGLGFIDYLILRPNAIITQLSFQGTLFSAMILVVTTGFVEEGVFRGVMQKAAGALGSWGWIYVAAIYALLQKTGHGSGWHVGFAFATGIVFGWVVKETGSILE